MNQASTHTCPRCQRPTARLINALSPVGWRVICCPPCAEDVAAGGLPRLDVPEATESATPGEGLGSVALDRARLDGLDATASALAQGVSGIALAAEVLEHVTALPFPELRWAALEGVAAALGEVVRQG